MAETARRVDPYRAFNFIVSIVGLQQPVSFTECTGLGSTTEVIDVLTSLRGRTISASVWRETIPPANSESQNLHRSAAVVYAPPSPGPSTGR